jgi:alpha-L-fucosidase
MYGIIIHYGLYSYYAYDDVNSCKRRTIQNGSEWYYPRLINSNNFAQIPGEKHTKAYHLQNYGESNYFDKINEITKDTHQIKNWVKFCKSVGAKYICLTVKHHDGLCLFDTKTTPNKSELDIVDIFVKECKEQNILYGFYYSWFQSDIPFTKKYFIQFCQKQLSELEKYEPNYLWFDGDWVIKQSSVFDMIDEICLRYKNLFGTKINSRIGKNRIKPEYIDIICDMNRHIPKPNEIILGKTWQYTETIGLSWGYNKQVSKKDYKDGHELYEIYNKINELDGELLVNIGPKITGEICQEEISCLEVFSELIENYNK